MINPSVSLSLEEVLKKVNEEYKFPSLTIKYRWEEGKVRLIYPLAALENVKRKYRAYFFSANKGERNQQLKTILDLHMAQEIDTSVCHWGIFVIYGSNYGDYDDFSEERMGKRRYQHYVALPPFNVLSNDEYIAYVWSSLILDNEHTDSWRQNPSFDKVRLLFEAKLFADYAGTHYDVDWVEPVSRGRDMECRTWTKEKDPMNPETSDEAYNVGPIILGTDGNGLRHFVNGEPIHAGSYIEVKFGDGWIPGRYEYSFTKDSPIRIYSKQDVIHIRDGHIVRVKS